MTYQCIECDYQSNNKSNYNKHLSTEYHKKKQNPLYEINNNHKNFICEYCEKSFTKSCNLTRHKATCKQKEIKSELEQALKIQKMELTIEFLKEENKLLKENRPINKIYNISIKNYLQQNYYNAPHLIELKNPVIEHEQEERTLIQALVHSQNNNFIDKFLGTYIIKNYKKEDLAKQSVWTSDMARLNFLVKELVSDNKSEWINDRKGDKVKKYIVNPLLNYVNKECENFIDLHQKKESKRKKKMEDRTRPFDDKNIEEQSQFLYNYHALNKIQANIKSGNLADDIVKYIAPSLCMDKDKLKIKKNDKIIEIEDDDSDDELIAIEN